MKVIKTGTITDLTTISTGLSSISFIMIYRKTMTTTGAIITLWHDEFGLNMSACNDYVSDNDLRVTTSTVSTYCDVSGGTFRFASSLTSFKPSSGVTYTWVAYGEK